MWRRRWWGHEGGPRELPRPFTMGGHSPKSAFYELGSRFSADDKSVSAWIVDSPASRTVGSGPNKRGQTPNICSLLPTSKIWVASILNSKSSWDHRGLTYWGNTCALRAILGNSSQSWNALNPFLFWPRGNMWRAAYLLRMAGALTWWTMDCVLHFFGP